MLRLRSTARARKRLSRDIAFSIPWFRVSVTGRKPCARWSKTPRANQTLCLSKTVGPNPYTSCFLCKNFRAELEHLGSGSFDTVGWRVAPTKDSATRNTKRPAAKAGPYFDNDRVIQVGQYPALTLIETRTLYWQGMVYLMDFIHSTQLISP
jgi:hypothetical protein